MDFVKTKNFYHEQLESVMDFWLKSDLIDKEYGGCITSVDRYGKKYNNEKSVWFQGRCLWTFSALCNKYEKRKEWLEGAASAKAFMEKYCVDNDGRMFFTVKQDGTPIRKRRYMFSESFYVISMAEYGLMNNDKDALDKAEKCFDLMYSIYKDSNADPYKITPKSYSSERSAAVLMVLFNSSQILRRCIPEKEAYYTEITNAVIKDMIKYHYKEDINRILETVGSNGEFIDTPAGRTVNPGHSCENSWFMMNNAVFTKNDDLLKTALSVFDGAIEQGIDDDFGGLVYFSDIKGRPCEPLEWDMKLWWVHCEALIGAIYAYSITKEEKYINLFEKLHEYTFSHFPDKEYGEWYGYLHRDGTVSHTQKGSMWKGPYHIPRCLMIIESILDSIENGKGPICIL